MVAYEEGEGCDCNRLFFRGVTANVCEDKRWKPEVVGGRGRAGELPLRRLA